MICTNCNGTGFFVLGSPYRDTVAFCDCDAGLVQAAAVAEGIRDIKAGRTASWKDVRRELGLADVNITRSGQPS